mgnify:CR=1 FL=1
MYFKVGNETRKYKMTSIRDVDPSDVKVLDEHKGEKNQLTLITCDDYNSNKNKWMSEQTNTYILCLDRDPQNT